MPPSRNMSWPSPGNPLHSRLVLALVMWTSGWAFTSNTSLPDPRGTTSWLGHYLALEHNGSHNRNPASWPMVSQADPWVSLAEQPLNLWVSVFLLWRMDRTSSQSHKLLSWGHRESDGHVRRGAG